MSLPPDGSYDHLTELLATAAELRNATLKMRDEIMRIAETAHTRAALNSLDAAYFALRRTTEALDDARRDTSNGRAH